MPDFVPCLAFGFYHEEVNVVTEMDHGFGGLETLKKHCYDCLVGVGSCGGDPEVCHAPDVLNALDACHGLGTDLVKVVKVVFLVIPQSVHVVEAEGLVAEG